MLRPGRWRVNSSSASRGGPYVREDPQRDAPTRLANGRSDFSTHSSTEHRADGGSFCCAKHCAHCCTVERAVSGSESRSIAVANGGTEYSSDAVSYAGTFCCSKRSTVVCSVERSVSGPKPRSVSVSNGGSKYGSDASTDAATFCCTERGTVVCSVTRAVSGS